jgi:eukaryotic-like serine/threonine-protein kinase
MASPVSVDEFLDLVHKSGVTDEKRLDSYVHKLRANSGMPAEPAKLAGLMVRDGILTQFQAEHIAQGKWRRFTIGKYKVLEKLGSGGMGSVFLCEHKLMRCMRAIKILPVAKAQDEAALGRFYREARAVAAIDHPNIVHAYDIDQDESLHFLVMEYVDGASLQELVKKSGPLSVLRACHYIHQSAIGLDHANRAGLVHRDIKPGNILVARDGAVKILDMGLARFFNDEEDILTRKFDENVLGTADYLAPEQAIDSHTVDIRADIYGLGATFYFMLTGKTPFGEGTIAQKLLWHQSRNPKSVRELRPDVPAGVEAIVKKMMAKDPADRYAEPGELAAALLPFVQTPIGPPAESEMPRLSPAASGRHAAETSEPAEVTSISRPETPKALKGMGGSGPGPKAEAKPSATPAPAAGSGPRVTAPAKPPSAPINPAPARATASAPAVVPGSGPRVSAPIKPTPATTPPAPALQSAVTIEAPRPISQEAADEEFGWQALAGDTADAARADTTPQQQGKPAAKPLLAGEQKAVDREKGVNRLVIALMIAAGLVVVVVGGLIWGGYLIYSNYIAPAVGPQTRPKLIVSSQDAGKPGVYKSIAVALRVAKKDDVIEIADESIEENISWEASPSRSTEVTIQAAPGKSVVWRSADRKDPRKPLLKLSNASFFKLKGDGITFDGDLGDKGKVRDLILILSSAEGLAIDGAQFKNFGRSGVAVINAAGNVEFPIRLRNLTALTPPADKDGGVFFLDAKPDMRIKQVDYIEITDVHAPGLLPAQVLRAENGALGGRYAKLPGN